MASCGPATMARALSVVLTAVMVEASGGQDQRQPAGQVPSCVNKIIATHCTAVSRCHGKSGVV